MSDLLGEELEDVSWELPKGIFRVKYRLGADNARELQRDSDTTMAGILVELKRAFHTKPWFVSCSRCCKSGTVRFKLP
jgi:hypothetical protein